MGKYASEVVKQAKAWLGKNEGDGSHRAIIDVYNSHKPLARGYKMPYNVAWCATFVSAVSIKLGYTDIMPTECSCGRMVELYQKLGRWVENENRKPNPGDIIFYDWGDSGKGDNKGWPDHVGIVEKVVGNNITVIEGNYDGTDADVVDGVERRTIAVNARYIRGYGVPKYDEEVVKAPVKTYSVSSCVKEGQQWLNEHYGDLIKKHRGALLAVDGKYGSKTRAAALCVWKDVVNHKYGFNLTPSNRNFYSSCKTAAKKAQIRKGATGTLVTIAQLILASEGYYLDDIDGSFGSVTDSAVRAFQKKNCDTVDGLIGAETWSELFN